MPNNYTEPKFYKAGYTIVRPIINNFGVDGVLHLIQNPVTPKEVREQDIFGYHERIQEVYSF